VNEEVFVILSRSHESYAFRLSHACRAVYGRSDPASIIKEGYAFGAAVTLNTQRRDGSMADEPVHLVPYDPRWPRRFEEERMLLEGALAPWIVGPIEHIGSTAVPELLAKPIIDIMVGVRDLPSSLDARDALAPLHYEYFPYRADVMHWFCKPSPARRTHHLHLVPVSSRLWAERLAFRDHLRASAEARNEYALLKASLAEHFRFDREAYTDAKADFVASIVERALGRGPHADVATPSE
jgi:GrpB-like predicted nucleotidyltransferase (UPF0157 family)